MPGQINHLYSMLYLNSASNAADYIVQVYFAQFGVAQEELRKPWIPV